MTEEKQHIADNTHNKMQDHLEYTQWVSQCVHAEITELDHYIQEKTKDLVHKFQNIAQDAIRQDQSSKTAEEQNAKTILISGRKFSYSDATIELKRLTDGLVADSVLTYERTLLRKKIEEMIVALFDHANNSTSFTEQTKSSVDKIKKTVMEIIMAFQFQDFVKQRLQHTQIALDALNTKTQSLLNEMQSNGVPKTGVPKEDAQALLDQFSLSKVQERFIAYLGENGGDTVSVTIENDDEDDIELF